MFLSVRLPPPITKFTNLLIAFAQNIFIFHLTTDAIDNSYMGRVRVCVWIILIYLQFNVQYTVGHREADGRGLDASYRSGVRNNLKRIL